MVRTVEYSCHTYCLQNSSAVNEVFIQELGVDFVLCEQPYSRPASTEQNCSNCTFRSIDTQTGMKDHLPVRTQQIQQEQAQV